MTQPVGERLIHNFSDGRDDLEGRPLHCGDVVKFWRNGKWIWARYEMAHTRTGDTRGYLIYDNDERTVWADDPTIRARWPEPEERS